MRNPNSCLPTIAAPVWSLLALTILASPARSQNLDFRAELSKPSVPVGEATVLSLRYVDCSPDETPQIPPIDGLEISYQGVSQGGSSSFTVIINGRTLQQKQSAAQHLVNYQIVPQKTGTFVIPPITSRINGKDYRTQAVRLVATTGIDYSQYAILKILPPDLNADQKLYQGQLFTLIAQLDTVRNTRVAAGITVPVDGLIINPSADLQRRVVQGNNGAFDRFFQQFHAHAIKTGKLALGPAQCTVGLTFRRNASNRHDPFRSFLSNPFDYEHKEIQIASKPLELEVLPLPREGRPESFNGAVGSFEFAAEISTNNVAVGDPITLTVTIDGKGKLEALKMPELTAPGWDSFRQYPENSQVNYRRNMTGSATFEKVVIPENDGITELPTLEFSYFDPELEAYRTHGQPPIPITVTPNLNRTQTPNFGTAEPEEPLDTIEFHRNKARLGRPDSPASPWLFQPVFLGAQLLPILVWIAGRLVIAHRQAQQRNPLALRRRKVKALVQQGVKELNRLAGDHRSDEFFATLFRLLQEQIGERLELPAVGITEAIVETDLRPAGLEEDELTSLNQLFQLCNQSRYAPINSSEELARITTQAEAILSRLQQLPQRPAA